MRYPSRLRHLALVAALAAGCSTADDTDRPDDFVPPNASGDDVDGEAYAPFTADSKADSLNLPDGPLKFGAACDEGTTVTIAAVGDVLLHGRLQQQAYASDDGFISLWSGIHDLLKQADLTYANLEGPTAAGTNAYGQSVRDPGKTFDGTVYSSYPMFNYHPSLLDDLQASGVDVVSTANNHSLDRRGLGADRTIDELEARGMAFTGTRKRGESQSDRPWYTITEAKGVRLAWLACTYGTNGIPDRDDQVLLCFRDEETVVGLVKELAARSDIDGVIVTPHWGDEYHASPNTAQVKLGHRLLDSGAIALIGSHPHVNQPWEKHVTPDGRETFAIYSLGNFVSGQSHLPRRSTLLLYLGLTKRADGTLVVNGARYVPLHMTRTSSNITLQAIDRVGGLEDSRALTVGMFHAYNVFPPEAPLRTNPQCDPSWTPPPSPHPHDGWIGGGCETDDVCGGALCLDNFAGGLCTERCESTCPDRAGRATTFCADLGFSDGGVCVARCARDADCREGYACKPVSRPSDADYVRSACVPVE